MRDWGRGLPVGIFPAGEVHVGTAGDALDPGKFVSRKIRVRGHIAE